MNTESADGISFVSASRSRSWSRIFWVGVLGTLLIVVAFVAGRFVPSPFGKPDRSSVYSIIEFNPDFVLPGTESRDPSLVGFRSYLETQVELVKSASVLSRTLTSPEVKRLPKIRTVLDPETWLRQALRVELLEGTNLILISLNDLELPEQAEVVNAVSKAYVDMARESSNRWHSESINIIKDVLNDLEKKLAENRANLKEEMATHPNSPRAAAIQDEIDVNREIWKKAYMVLNTRQEQEKIGARIELVQMASVPNKP